MIGSKIMHCTQILVLVVSASLLRAGEQGGASAPANPESDGLSQQFLTPPDSAKPRLYWFWLNSHIDKPTITRDLEELRRKGFGGALVFDIHDSDLSAGPAFLSPEWRELFRHALREAARLGLELSANVNSGWNCGGPWISAEHTLQRLVWAEKVVHGPASLNEVLPRPNLPAQPPVTGRETRRPSDDYWDVAVLAVPLRQPSPPRSLPLWEQKAYHRENEEGITPDLSWRPESLLNADQALRSREVIDLSSKMAADGRLRWEAPAGDWLLLRFGHVPTGTLLFFSNPGGHGWMADHMSAEAEDIHFAASAGKLIEDAGPLAGKTFKYLMCDSCDLRSHNWSQKFPEEFKKRRGYEIWPYLPALAGRVVDSAEVSERFLYDFRRTLGDCIADNHYGRFRELAHEHGLEIMTEAGGPPPVPIDALQCQARNDVPMAEFWAGERTMFVRGAACTAHAWGQPLAVAEAFTSKFHWSQGPFELKRFGDRAFCEGINLMFLHGFSSSPLDVGKPGRVYYAGTHFNPNITWWEQSNAFTDYLSRCQLLLQQGRFVADVCFYYGDHVPNFIPPGRDRIFPLSPVSLGPGYGCDFVPGEVILKRMSVRDGRLMLPDGMSYRVLALADTVFEGHRDAIQSELLKKILELVEAGAIIVWPKPSKAPGLRDYPQCDQEVQRLAARLWGPCGGKTVTENRLGRGRVIWGRTVREVLRAKGVEPDFEFQGNSETALDYIHRRDGATDIYFVVNRLNFLDNVRCTFRVADRAPELWDPLTGEGKFATAYRQTSGHTTVPLQLPPHGSLFVVFRSPAKEHPATSSRNSPNLALYQELGGPWTVRFDPAWGGPASTRFEQLISWTKRPEPGIKYYSGTAIYEQVFDLPAAASLGQKRLWLDLGEVRHVAEVRFNGTSLGILWSPPFRSDITAVACETNNQLQVTVVNLWPNRIIGDERLPAEGRYTRTNIRRLVKDTPLADTPLLESGLLGPVRVLVGVP